MPSHHADSPPLCPPAVPQKVLPHLPPELWLHVLSSDVLTGVDLLQIEQVDRSLRAACAQPEPWRHLLPPEVAPPGRRAHWRAQYAALDPALRGALGRTSALGRPLPQLASPGIVALGLRLKLARGHARRGFGAECLGTLRLVAADAAIFGLAPLHLAHLARACGVREVQRHQDLAQVAASRGVMEEMVESLAMATHAGLFHGVAGPDAIFRRQVAAMFVARRGAMANAFARRGDSARMRVAMDEVRQVSLSVGASPRGEHRAWALLAHHGFDLSRGWHGPGPT